MKRILVLAYQLSPLRGSEYSVAWNYVTQMSKDHQLVILFGASGDHMGDTNELYDYIKKHHIVNLENVKFVSVRPNYLTSMLNIPNKKGWFKYSFYIAYRVWQKQAYIKALELNEIISFDLIHYLNPIGFREPGYLWKIDLPYMWGPISGTISRPKSLFVKMPLKEKFLFKFRNYVNEIQFKYNNRFKNVLNRTDLLLTATTENQNRILEQYNCFSEYIPENAIVNDDFGMSNRCVEIKPNEIVHILWIGTIEARKSLNILLDSLSLLNVLNWELHVIGDGPKRNQMELYSIEKFLSNKIVWHGFKPRSEVLKLLNIGHLHVITSLGEGNPTTIWETMSYNIPTITLNHCGMKDVVCNECGVKIDIQSYEQVVADLSEALSYLITNPNRIEELSKGVNRCRDNYTWDKRRLLFNEFYDIAIKNWKEKK